MGNQEKIEDRIKRLKNIYNSLESIIDKIPDSFPDVITDTIKKQILGDQALKDLMNQIEHHRPPRILMVGRTGTGKSSLINALCGGYVAEVSNVGSCTSATSIYSCKDGDRILMDIMDSRGIAEPEGGEVSTEISAEEQMLHTIQEFNPDIVLSLFNCVEKGKEISDDIEFIKTLRKRYYTNNGIEIPVIVVLNKADEAAPAQQKMDYKQQKLDVIYANKERYRSLINKSGLRVSDIIPVSALITWGTDSDEYTAEQINSLTMQEIKNLIITFDGRFNIDKLREAIEDNIEDYDAKMGMRMAFRIDELVTNLAKQIVKVMSGISAAIAVSPIPVADIYPLIAIQCLTVMMIAALSGREMSMETAKEFIISVSGVGIAGFIFKNLAQQSVKLANALFPGAGSFASSTIAATGTAAIGNAAIEYYIKGLKKQHVKRNFKKGWVNSTLTDQG